jgi:HTH-type transcriptional regulator/antitoxin HigA
MNSLAEVFPPGDFIREELDARGWTQSDLAEIMGRPTETINRIIAGKLAITPETAKGLGAAFGTSADYWLNLESQFQLSEATSDDQVARRARLYELAPISEMVKRGWIESSSNVEVLERQVMDFFDLDDISEKPEMAVAARMSTPYGEINQAQMTWVHFVKRLASTLDVPSFSKRKLEAAIRELKSLTGHPEEVRHVPRILAEAGIRFVVVKHVTKSKIDGAAFWLDKSEKMPVVALSMRYDRIDIFWHTLFHELGHISHGDGLSVDDGTVGETKSEREAKPEYERAADDFATELLVDQEELDDFIDRVRPLYSKKKIIGFAARIGIHPGLVVGQLQHREEISFTHSREMLVKVRDTLTSSALTDGWKN